MSEARQSDTDGLVRRFEEFVEREQVDPLLKRELVALFKEFLDQRTPEDEFSDFVHRLVNRQGTRTASFESLYKQKSDIDHKLYPSRWPKFDRGLTP